MVPLPLFPHKLCDWIRADDYTTSANILLVQYYFRGDHYLRFTLLGELPILEARNQYFTQCFI